MEVSIDQIRPSPYQPRLYFELETIKDSIIQDGMLVIPLVRPKPEGKTEYELIDGERRWRAAQELGWKTINVQIADVDDETARRMVFTLNEERQPYTIEEYTKFFRRIYEQMGSAYAVAQAYRKSQQTVWRYINISILPEHLQKAVWAGKITMGDIEEMEPVFTEARSEIGDITSYRKYSESPSYQKLVAWCERIYTQQIQSKEELREEYVDPYLEMLDKARVQKAKEEVEKSVPSHLIEAKVTLETPEEFEKAAEALRREAERRKTAEQKAEEKRLKLIAQARKSLNSVLKKIDGSSKTIDVSVFRERISEIEKSLEQNPAEMREQLIALGKEVDGAKKQRQKEIEEEKRKKREEEIRRKLEEEVKRNLEEEKKRLEEETRKNLEAERRRIEEEAEKKLVSSREFLEQAAKMVHVAKLREEYMPELKQTRLAPMVNVLNELTGDEWLKFTKSWYVFDALASDLEEERAVTIDVVEHPATFSPTMISEYVRFFTKKEEVILDPFVGIGSTLVACMRAGRKGIGIDINPKYCEITKKRVEDDPGQMVICGDAWEIEKYNLPTIDYCITSPPYFTMLEKIDVTQKKRMQAGLETDYGDVLIPAKDVDDYISKLVDLFNKIANVTKDGGYLTVILQNFRDKERMSPLAWKFAMTLESAGKWVFKGERIWCQDHKSLHPFGYPADWVPNVHHHYCPIFRKVKK